MSADGWIAGRAPGRAVARGLLLACCMLAAGTMDARAQAARDTVAPAVSDTAPRTPREEALERLRAMEPLGRRAVTGTDTTAADEAGAQDGPRAGDAVAPPGNGRRVRGMDATSGIAHDSVMQALMALPGYAITEYRGGRAWFDAETARLELHDEALVVRDGQKLEADSSLIYWERRALACGYGKPVFSGRGVEAPVTSDSLCYDVDRGIGLALGAETTVSEGALWRVRGDVYFDPVSGAAFGHDAIFTDCDEPFPHVHYHFAARRMKVKPNNVLVARDVTLNFGDVPVFWLPFMVQSLAQGRRSGLLMPRFSVNDIARSSPRYNRRVEDIGFYWAMNDYMGTEVALDWFNDNYTALRGSFDYRWRERFLSGGVTFNRFWRQGGRREFMISTANSWQPDERTSLSVSGNYVTSSDFVRQYTFDPREINRTMNSQAGMNRRFNWGSVSLNADRRHQLADNTVEMTLPSLGVTLNSITLFEAQPGDARWYSGLTWQGGAQTTVRRRSIDAANPRLSEQGRRITDARANSAFTLGRLSWSQGFSVNEEIKHARQVPGDSIIELPGSSLQRMQWNSSVGYQQRLIGTSTLTPTFSINGGSLRSDRTDGQTVAAPLRMNFGADLRTDIFGFWPGLGPFETLRHRVSPSFNYTYSPAPRVTERQREVFGISGEIREQNLIRIGLNQTIEAKYRQRTDRAAPGADAESEADAAAAEDALTGEPRRRSQAERISLLSITTDAVVYDFVAARREGRGVQTTRLGNSLQSDLLRGLQIRFSHDLFREVLDEEGTRTGEREFAPHLETVSASFSLDSNWWLFRLLGLGGRSDTPTRGAEAQDEQDLEDGREPVRGRRGLTDIRAERPQPAGGARGAVGSWRASFNYNLQRPRPGSGGLENQMLTAAVAFQPTEQWQVSWNTGYSFTTREFTDHYLTLTRRMHDWDANFDFVRAQNGNFSFVFRVALRANPDVKVDYQQRDVSNPVQAPVRR